MRIRLMDEDRADIMEPGVSIEAVRRVVLQTLVEIGLTQEQTAVVQETTLFRDPAHAGRRFQCHAVRAVWFADAAAIEFFTENGQFLKSVALQAPVRGTPVAA